MKAFKIDVAAGPGVGVGLKVGKAKLALNAHFVAGFSVGGKSGFEGFAERESYVEGKMGNFSAGLGFDSVRWGAAPEPIRERKTTFGFKDASVDSDGIIGFEATPLIGRVKAQVDLGAVLFAFFGEDNGWEPDGIP